MTLVGNKENMHKVIKRIILIVFNSIWFIYLSILFLSNINHVSEIEIHPTELEDCLFGSFFEYPVNFEKSIYSKDAYYLLIYNLNDSESKIRNVLNGYISKDEYDMLYCPDQLFESIYYLYYIPGTKLEKIGEYDIAREKFRRGLNHCYYFAKKFHIGDRKFQRMYSSFRLRFDFYKRYGTPKKNNFINSSFYDTAFIYNDLNEEYLKNAYERTAQIKKQDIPFRRLFGLSNSIYYNLTFWGMPEKPSVVEKQLLELIILNYKYIINFSEFDLIEESYYKIGYIYYISGDYFEAKKNFKKLIEKFPSSYLADDAIINLINIESNPTEIDRLEDLLKNNYQNSDLAKYYFVWN